VQAHKLPVQTWIAIAAYLLALGLGVLISALVAIVFVAAGTLALLMGVASSEWAQRQAPGLGAIPFVHGHGFRSYKSSPRTDDDDAERRELLRLTLAVHTELETARYQLSQAKESRQGWGNNHLPAATFSEWAASAIAAPRTDVRAALDGYYVWANAINQEMEQRAAREYAQVGQQLSGKTSALDDADIVALDEGLSRIRNAQEHLDSLRDELSQNGNLPRSSAVAPR